MKKIFLLLTSVFFSTMMFSQVLLWKDGEVIYSKNIDEVDKISFYEVEDFELVNDEIVLELYRDWDSKYKWIYAEFTPKKSYGILQYTSSDENVVTVSYDGRLVARGVGEATVTVKLIGTELEKKCKVKVVGFRGTFKFDFDSKNVMLGVSTQIYFYSNYFDPYCYFCRENLEWSSSDENVATIVEEQRYEWSSKEIYVKGESEGQTTITAKLKGTDITDSFIVNVKKARLMLYADYNHYGEETYNNNVGNYVYLHVEFEENLANVYDYEFEWTTSNESVVRFDNPETNNCYNYLHCDGVGDAEITVKVKDTDIQTTLKISVVDGW